MSPQAIFMAVRRGFHLGLVIQKPVNLGGVYISST